MLLARPSGGTSSQPWQARRSQCLGSGVPWIQAADKAWDHLGGRQKATGIFSFLGLTAMCSSTLEPVLEALLTSQGRAEPMCWI